MNAPRRLHPSLAPIALFLACGTAGAQEAPLRLAEDFRFGAVSGPQELTRVGAVLPSADGRHVYVAQPQEARLVVVDVREGRLLRSMGRRGRGPGEFDLLGRLGWRADSLYAVDRVLQRVVFFTAQGEHLRTERIISSEVVPGGVAPALPLALAPDGTVIGSAQVNMVSAARGRVRANPLVRMTRGGELLATLDDGDLEGVFSEQESGGMVIVGIPALTPRDRRGISPDGSTIVLVDVDPPAGGAATFTVTRIGFEGDTLYRRGFRYRPLPVPEEIRDSMLEERAAWHEERQRVSRARARELAEESLALPEAQAPVDAVLVGDDGTVWLKRERRALGLAHWQVLDPAGRLRAIVETPSALRIAHVRRDTVWGVLPGELDEPYVVRYRVVAGASR